MLKALRGKLQALQALRQHLVRFKNWRESFAAYRRGQRLPSLCLRSGLTFHHGPEDDAWSLYREVFLDRCYTARGFYDPHPSDVVFDVGANIGAFALHLSELAPGITVHCFEPGENTRRRLRRNVEENQLRNVVIHPYGVFNKNTTLKLQPASQAGGASVVGATEGETIECVTFQKALEMAKVSQIDLLKVDIEGAEIELFDSADLSIVKRVVLEYHEGIRPGCRDHLTALLRTRFSDVKAWATDEKGELGIIQATRRA